MKLPRAFCMMSALQVAPAKDTSCNLSLASAITDFTTCLDLMQIHKSALHHIEFNILTMDAGGGAWTQR